MLTKLERCVGNDAGIEERGRWHKGARHLCRFNVADCLEFENRWPVGSRSGVNAALRARFNGSSAASFRLRRT